MPTPRTGKTSRHRAKTSVGSPRPEAEERERDDLRVREPFEGLGASSMGVEQLVSGIHEAEEDGQSFFREDEPSGKLGASHLLPLRKGSLRWPLSISCRIYVTYV